MLISIIVPIYNSEKYLKRCVDSLLNQEYTNLEIILVNDGSKDSSLQICKDFLNKDNRIVLVDQVNKGLPGARNSGMSVANGDYFCFVDSDDIIDSNMIFDFINVIINHSPDVIISNIYQYNSSNEKYSIMRNNMPYGELMNLDQIKKFILELYYVGYLGVIPSAWSKMYKKSFLIDNDLTFNEKLKRSEDYWFNLYVFKYATSVYAIDKAYYHYFANEGSMIRSYRADEYKMYVDNRERLLSENIDLNCNIDWPNFDKKFIENVNEYILLSIISQGFFKIYNKNSKILSDKYFRNILFKNSFEKRHIQIIKFFLKFKCIPLALFTYYIWSLKIKK